MFFEDFFQEGIKLLSYKFLLLCENSIFCSGPKIFFGGGGEQLKGASPSPFFGRKPATKHFLKFMTVISCNVRPKMPQGRSVSHTIKNLLSVTLKFIESLDSTIAFRRISCHRRNHSQARCESGLRILVENFSFLSSLQRLLSA